MTLRRETNTRPGAKAGSRLFVATVPEQGGREAQYLDGERPLLLAVNGCCNWTCACKALPRGLLTANRSFTVT